jgi:hypothetical protein
MDIFGSLKRVFGLRSASSPTAENSNRHDILTLSFANQEDFKIQVYFLQDFPSIRLWVADTRHPLLNIDTHYFGKETHNPQFTEALEVIGKVFDDWYNQDVPSVFKKDGCFYEFGIGGMGVYNAELSLASHSQKYQFSDVQSICNKLAKRLED